MKRGLEPVFDRSEAENCLGFATMWRDCGQRVLPNYCVTCVGAGPVCFMRSFLGLVSPHPKCVGTGVADLYRFQRDDGLTHGTVVGFQQRDYHGSICELWELRPFGELFQVTENMWVFAGRSQALRCQWRSPKGIAIECSPGSDQSGVGSGDSPSAFRNALCLTVDPRICCSILTNSSCVVDKSISTSGSAVLT